MSSLLGGLSPATFLRRHWQKRPLLVRQALPQFAGLIDRDAMFALATRGDAISRLIIQHPRRRQRWERHDGPFGGLDAGMLPPSHWTLLIHGLESLVPGGWELLREFSFIPAARIDDLMVSYAADGGSVGPHDDRYDVFLLQGPGKRRWQVSTRGDHAVAEDQAIKVLKNFVAEDEWLLEPGDMLYLPPGVAHHGVAEGPCLTYSIGFLAPTHEALIQNFLGYLGEVLAPAIDPDAIYADPDLKPPADPLAVPDAMVRQVSKVLRAIRWDEAVLSDFIGRFLTGPKPHVIFSPPSRPLNEERFARRLRGHGRVALALPSRGLLRGGQLFFNGEAHRARPATLRHFEKLLIERSMALPLSLDERTLALLHGWYLRGYLVVR
ncbi:MAG: cupin protein [Myxococcales bacterium]|nr:cupin protein [Myxococcales bacterium]